MVTIVILQNKQHHKAIHKIMVITGIKTFFLFWQTVCAAKHEESRRKRKTAFNCPVHFNYTIKETYWEIISEWPEASTEVGHHVKTGHLYTICLI